MTKGANYLKNGGEKAGFTGRFFKDMFAGVKSLGDKEGGSETEGEGKEFKFEDRDLNGEEKTGLLILGGIVVGGFVLGGITRPKSKAAEKH